MFAEPAVRSFPIHTFSRAFCRGCACAVVALWVFWQPVIAGGTSESPSSAVRPSAEPPAGREIIDRPIRFGPLREELTLRYIRAHYDPQAASTALTPRMIVVHWTASAKLRSALAAFEPEELPPGRPELERSGRLNVSAHYLVDRDGTIYRLMPPDRMARHTIGLNRVAIGIENVGGPRWPLTEAQLAANARLVRELVATYPDLRYLIGHHEYGRFRGTPLWEERDPSYYTGKQDPGPAFMERLRAAVHDLNLLDR